jgi:hypothetical protein
MQVLVASIALRRTKDQRVNGRPLVALPSKTVHHVVVRLDEVARAKYDHWQAAGEHGPGSLLGWLAPVRRHASHPTSTLRKLASCVSGATQLTTRRCAAGISPLCCHPCSGRALVDAHLRANTLLQNYTAVLEVLLRLRQVRAGACSSTATVNAASVVGGRVATSLPGDAFWHCVSAPPLPCPCRPQICCDASLAPGDDPTSLAQQAGGASKLTPELAAQLVELLRAGGRWGRGWRWLAGRAALQCPAPDGCLLGCGDLTLAR